MARLTPELWAMARADYEIRGLSVTELAKKYGCAKSAVSMRAKADGWQAGKTEQAVTEKANAIITLAQIEQQTEQKLNATERAVFDVAVMENDADMETICKHIMALLPGMDKPADVKAAAETLRIARESRLGKTPDTAIQINNSAPARIERVIVDAH